MYIDLYKKRTGSILLFIFFFILSFGRISNAQDKGLYPPFTKWYQDPLGLRPVELSSAAGFVWGSAAVAACLIFTKKDAVLQKKSSIYYESGFGFGYKPPYTNALQNNTGLLYKVRQWMALGMEWNVFYFADDTNNTWSFGARPFVRWYPFVGKKLSLFFEYGAGLSYSLNRFPLTGTGLEKDTARTGTRFNFSTKYGIGTEIRLHDRVSLQAGIRHFHVSNGNIAGILRNPSHDSNGLFLGLLYNLKNNKQAKGS